MADDKGSIDDKSKVGQKGEHLPDIGDHYMVQRNDNTWHSAEVIQIRSNESSGGGNSAFEYYIHYEGLNRRLDEWIDLSRLVSGWHSVILCKYPLICYL